MTRDPSKRFMGKPCAKGHSGERYVNGNVCCECAAESGKRRRQTVPYHRKAFARNGSHMTEEQSKLLEVMRVAIREEVAAIMRSR